MMKPRVFVIPLIMTVFAVVVIVLSLQLDKSPPMIVGDSMQPRAFPIFLMVLLLILTGLLLMQFIRNEPKSIPLEPLTTWGSIALMVVFYVVTKYVDMFIAVAVVMFFMGLLWGSRWWVALITAIVTPASIFLLFDTVLRIRFPRGLFTNWWYS